MKKLILSMFMLVLITACAGESPTAQCEMEDVKKFMFFSDDKDMVNKIDIEEYQISVDMEDYEEGKSFRQEHLDMVNGINGISASESLKGNRLTKTYTIVFDELDEEMYDDLTNEYNFGNDLSLSTLLKNYESTGYVCK